MSSFVHHYKPFAVPITIIIHQPSPARMEAVLEYSIAGTCENNLWTEIIDGSSFDVQVENEMEYNSQSKKLSWSLNERISKKGVL